MLKDIDLQKLGIMFYSMSIECILNWSKWYKDETIFDFLSAYNDLVKANVVFPEKCSYFLDFEYLGNKYLKSINKISYRQCVNTSS